MAFTQFVSNFLQSSVFELYKQPIVPIVASYDYDKLTQSVPVQYEILLRAVNDRQERISAYEMIQEAERYGWAQFIDDEVLKRTLRYLIKNYSLDNNNILYHINLSGGTINKLGISTLMSIMGRLDECEINHNQLCFEITETVSIDNIDKVRTISEELKRIGCKIALDDFGESLISFDNLKQIKPDFLKIAGKYIVNATRDKYYEALIGSISSLCKHIGVATIAEHVETRKAYELLYELEVDYSQGWFTGYPVPLESCSLPSGVGNIPGVINTINKTITDTFSPTFHLFDTSNRFDASNKVKASSSY